MPQGATTRTVRPRSRLRGPEDQVAALRELLVEQEERAALIRSRLDDLESSIRASTPPPAAR